MSASVKGHERRAAEGDGGTPVASVALIVGPGDRFLSGISYYVAFAYWKLACILEGVFVRYAARATGTDASDADALAVGVADRAHRALVALQS